MVAAELERVIEHSHTLRERSAALADQADRRLRKSDALLAISARHHAILSHSHRRYDTSTPPATPPELRCPTCDGTLHYERSHVGGVSEKHAEQWDYFSCSGPCGRFEYRQRTRKLRSLQDD